MRNEPFPPLRDDHPLVGKLCPICVQPFEGGQETTLVELGPASDEDFEKATTGRAYTAEAVPIHWDCRS